MSWRSHLITASAVALAGCDLVTLSTATGEHVTYHWDPSEQHLCGGTVPYADRVVEAMLRHYGYSDAPGGGPTIEYFWSVSSIEADLCWTLSHACTLPTPSGRARWSTSIFTTVPIHPHELAHAAIQFRHHGIPSFLGEGMATQWGDSALAGPQREPRPLALDEAEIRDRIDRVLTDEADYAAAYAWWRALEVRFGGAKMGDLAAALDFRSSSGDVDAALRATLGITLAESVALAQAQALTYDDSVDCRVEGLEEFVWSGEDLRLDRGGAACSDTDIVNWNARVAWPFVLEVPSWTEVEIQIDEAGPSQGLHLVECRGQPDPTPNILVGGNVSHTRALEGRYFGYLLGDLSDDGAVTLPSVTLRASEP